MALIVGGTEVTSTAAELNIMDGVTSTAAELNIMDGVTSTAAELNELDGFSGDLTGAFTLGSNSQFKEIARGVEMRDDSDYKDISGNVGGSNGLWLVYLSSNQGDGYKTTLFSSTENGTTQNSSNLLANSAMLTRWNDNAIEVAHYMGGAKNIYWCLYQLQIH